VERLSEIVKRLCSGLEGFLKRHRKRSWEIWGARLLPSQKRQRVVSSEWRLVKGNFSGGQRFCAAEFVQKISVVREHDPPATHNPQLSTFLCQPASAGFVTVNTDLESVGNLGERGNCRAKKGCKFKVVS